MTDEVSAAATTLSGVFIQSADVVRHARVFELVTGIVPEVDGHSVRFHVAGVTLFLDPPPGHGPGREGIVRVRLSVHDSDGHRDRLQAEGADITENAGRTVVSPGWLNGLGVEFAAPSDSPGGHRGDASFDHVAVLVGDMAAAIPRWQLVVGAPPSHIGPHPLGGSDTARFELGRHMVELVSPWRSVSSPMLKRLENSGEGPLALALPVKDLAESAGRLEAAGIQLVRQPPHVFVHPRDAAGVLLQLTPRVAH